MKRSILKKYLTSKWIWLLLIELVIIGGLVYQFIPHKPTWGAVPQQIARIDLAPFAGGPIKSVPLPAQNRMYVLTHAEKVVVFEDTKVITTFPTGHHGVPEIVADDKTSQVYIMNDYEEVINIIEGTTIISSEVLAGARPRDIAVNPTTGLVYVISNYEKDPDADGRDIKAGYLTVLDGPNISQTLYLGPLTLHKVAVDPIYNTIYIGSWTDPYLIILDKNLKEVARIQTKWALSDMAVNPTTGEVYIVSLAPHLQVYQQGVLQGETMLGDGPRHPEQVLFHSITEELYIIDTIRLEMMVVKDMALLGYVPLEIEPANMAVDPLTGNVYVANARSGTVSVINGIELLDTIKVGAYPYGIGVNPNNGWVYVSNTNGDSVTILGFE